MVADARPRCACGALLDFIGPDSSRCTAGHETKREKLARPPVQRNGATLIPYSRFSAESAGEKSEPARARFPIEVLPVPVRAYVEAAARAIGVPVDMVAVPLLGTAGAVIGNTCVIELKPGYWQRPTLYVGVVAPPGSAKSPGIDAGRAPADVLQTEAHQRFLAKMADYEAELQRWSDTPKAERGEKPQPPALEHFFTTNATLEALAHLLNDSPGVALMQDELVLWVKACDAYRGGRGGDRQLWLSLWAGAPLKIDRRGSGPLYVPHPCVPVVGGVQPDMLPSLADEAGRQDGFIDRILWTMPEAPPALWTDAEVPLETRNTIVAVFRRLRVSGEPRIVKLGAAAREVWREWYDENAVLTAKEQGLVAGIYAKMPNQCARLCLVLHCLEYAGQPDSALVSEATMADAILLAEYFRSHALLVVPRFGATASPRSAGLKGRVGRILERAAAEWVSRSEINDRLGGHVPAMEIGEALDALAIDGKAESRKLQTKGRPLEEWRTPVQINAEERENGKSHAPAGVGWCERHRRPLLDYEEQQTGQCKGCLEEAPAAVAEGES